MVFEERCWSFSKSKICDFKMGFVNEILNFLFEKLLDAFRRDDGETVSWV